MSENLIQLASDVEKVLTELKQLAKPIKDMGLSDGHWLKEVTKDALSKSALKELATLKLQPKATLSLHLTQRSDPPIDGFEGSALEKESAFASIEIASTVDATLEQASPTGVLSAEVKYGAQANASARYVQHRKTTGEATGAAAIRGLLRTLRNPFDPDSVASLERGEVLQLELGGSAALRATAGWSYGLTRELAGGTLASLGVSTLPLLDVGVKAGLTLTASLSGELRLLVMRSEKGAEKVRVQLHKRSGDMVGVGLKMTAAASVTQLDGFVTELVRKALKPSPELEATDAYKKLLANVADEAKQVVEKGLKAELEAGINRSSSLDALLDLDITLPERADVYRQMLAGDFTDALDKAVGPGANGVELNACSLKEVVKKLRSLSLHLNLLGFDLTRELKAYSEKTVTRGGDGAIWLSGKAGASLKQKAGEELETAALVFDLVATKLVGEQLQQPPTYSARLERSFATANSAEIRTLLPQHLKGAVALGLLDEEKRQPLEAAFVAEAGTYTFELAIDFPWSCLNRVFCVDRAELGEKGYVAHVWRTFGSALRCLDATVPSTDSKRPCPMSLLLTEDRIATISERPYIALDISDPSPIAAAGYRFDPPHARIFWLQLGHVYYFVRSLAATRQALLRGTVERELAKQLTSLAHMAAALRDGVGAVKSRSIEAQYLMLALLAGERPGGARITFKRGKLEVTV